MISCEHGGLRRNCEICELRVELDEAHAELHAAIGERDDLRAERDALKAGRWAGPWVTGSDGLGPVQYRETAGGSLIVRVHVNKNGGAQWYAMSIVPHPATAETIDAGMAAADAALRAAGWWLA